MSETPISPLRARMRGEPRSIGWRYGDLACADRGFVPWPLSNAGRHADVRVASSVSGPASETGHRFRLVHRNNAMQ